MTNKLKDKFLFCAAGRLTSKQLKIIIFLFIVGISCLAYQHPVTFDATHNKNNSLSAGNIALLSKLDKPLSIELFTLDKSIAEQIQTIIIQFQEKNKNILFHVNTTPLSPQEKSNLGLHSNHHLLLTYGDRKKTMDVNILKWNQQVFSNLLQQIIQDKEPWVVFLSGHGEQDPFLQENRNLNILTTELKNKGIKIAAINLSETGVIPDNTQTLVIADNRTALLPYETNQISTYLNRGGNLLWLVNPNTTHGLEKLVESLGITWIEGTIFDYQAHTMGTPDPAISIITQYPSHPITHQLNMLTVFPWSTPFEYSKALTLGWKVTPLLNTNAKTIIKNEQNLQGPFTIGAAFTKGNQRVVVIGNGHFLSNSAIHHYGNLTLANNIFNWLNNTDVLLTANYKPAIDLAFTQNIWTKITIQYLFPYGLSLIYLFIAWHTKRSRRQKHRFLSNNI
jgi:ABC-type uncharacterized transport system involved in gliding motility auxiliary subunit